MLTGIRCFDAVFFLFLPRRSFFFPTRFFNRIANPFSVAMGLLFVGAGWRVLGSFLGSKFGIGVVIGRSLMFAGDGGLVRVDVV